VLDFREFRHSQCVEPLGEIRRQIRRGDRNEFRMVARNLVREFLQVASGGKCRHTKTVRHGIHDG